MLWLLSGLGLLIVIAATLAWVHRERIEFRYNAYRYRNGDYNRVWELSYYCKVHYAEFTEAELIELLGPARTTDMNSYTGTIPEWLARLGLKPNGSEVRLWYSENGPPDHRVPDESGNICFLLRDGRVIDYYELFP